MILSFFKNKITLHTLFFFLDPSKSIYISVNPNPKNSTEERERGRGKRVSGDWEGERVVVESEQGRGQADKEAQSGI